MCSLLLSAPLLVHLVGGRAELSCQKFEISSGQESGRETCSSDGNTTGYCFTVWRQASQTVRGDNKPSSELQC